jgi:glycosyltransferase involved in cell wall biosynthesis
VRLLLVSQLAPPSGLIAARRVAALTKYLARRGFEITVLTSQVSGEGEIEGAAEVVRTPDLLASGLNWRRKQLEVMSAGVPGTYRRPSPLQSVIVPDPAAVSWLPFALPRALKLARERRFDCVLTTSPPQSAHLVGAALARRGLCWIAELRDGWTFEPPRPDWPLSPLRAFDRRLEGSLKRATGVVGVTEPIAADLRDRLGLDAHVITNGFDPDEQPGEVGEPLLDPARHSFVHAGRVEVTGTKLDPLLEALRSLGEAGIEVVFAGPLSETETEQLAAPDLAGIARVVGVLDRPRVLRLQREADTLLLITEGARRTSVATGKLFEYLAAERPILVLGDETEAARIVEKTGTGEATSASDPAAIAHAFERAAGGELSVARDPAALARYSWPELAGAYAELIERACG